MSGQLNIDVVESDHRIKPSKASLLTKVDKKIVSKEEIPKEVFHSGYEIKKRVRLKEDQVSSMTLVVKDNIGLEHHYLIDIWTGYTNSQSEPEFDKERIYSPDGKLLWE